MGTNRAQVLVAAGILVVAAALAWGAVDIRSEAGYGGVGPNFLPWVVAGALGLLGAALLREALSGGFRELDPPEGATHGDWVCFAWVSAGLLANAALIEHAGFVLSCAICYLLAARGFRLAQGQVLHGITVWAVDLLVGVAIAAPVFWMFGKGLGIQLPALTATGWL